MQVPRARRFHAALAAALCLAAAALAHADEPRFQAAVQHFQQAAAGDDDAIDAAAGEFQALAQAQPDDPALLAYAGAAQAMRARATRLPWKKMSYTDDGLGQVDKALAMLGPADDARLHRDVPDSLETRFVAASVFLALPEMFHREARGQRLLADLLASPLLARAPLSFRGAVWLRAGQAAAQAALAKARLRELGQ